MLEERERIINNITILFYLKRKLGAIIIAKAFDKSIL